MIDVLRHLVMVDVAIQGFYSHIVEQESKFGANGSFNVV